MENIPNEIVDSIHSQIVEIRRGGLYPKFLIVDQKTFQIIRKNTNGYFVPIYQTEEKIAHEFVGLLVAIISGEKEVIEVRG